VALAAPFFGADEVGVGVFLFTACVPLKDDLRLQGLDTLAYNKRVLFRATAFGSDRSFSILAKIRYARSIAYC